MNDEDFETWYDHLIYLAEINGVSVSDEDAWREEWEAGKSFEEAFYDEYPELRISDE